MGIEPTSSAWEAEVLPLNYTRFRCLSDFKRFRGFGSILSSHLTV
jgi:hypothetical protein